MGLRGFLQSCQCVCTIIFLKFIPCFHLTVDSSYPYLTVRAVLPLYSIGSNRRIIYKTSKMSTAIVDLYIFRTDVVKQHPLAALLLYQRSKAACSANRWGNVKQRSKRSVSTPTDEYPGSIPERAKPN